MTGAVLVTGGAGFIGRHVVAQLLERGRPVRVLDDLSTGRRHGLHPEVDLRVGDITDPGAVRRAVAGVEGVVHLAARRAVPRSFVDPEGTDLVNRLGTAVVLDAAARAGVRRVVSASSSSVYGDAGRVPTTEAVSPRPMSPYACSKVAGEELCRVASRGGLDTVSLRYFNVYGPGQQVDTPYPTLVPVAAAALLRGEPVVVHGDGRQRRDFTYVEDAARATLAALDVGEALGGRPVNVAGGRSWTVLEVVDRLACHLGVRAEVRHAATRLGDPRHTEADLTLARELLGYRPQVALVDGLARFVAQLRAASPPPAEAGQAHRRVGRPVTDVLRG